MFRLIIFYLFKRLKLAFSKNQRAKTTIVLLFYGGIALLYGFLLGNFFYEKGYNIDTVLYAIHLFVSSLMIISIWFPQPAQKDAIIASIYPISKLKRAFFHWFVSLWGGGMFSATLLYVSFLYSAGTTSLSLLLGTVAIVVALWTIRKSIITLMLSRFRYGITFWLSIFLLPLSIYCTLLPVIHDLPEASVTITLIPALAAYVLLELSALETRKVERSKRSLPSFLKITSLQLLAGHSTARNTLLFGYVLRVFFIVQLYVVASGQLSGFEGYLAVLFASPLLTFTYVYNNTWGFFKEAWIHIDYSANSVTRLFREYLRFLFFPLMVDAFIGLAFILVAPKSVFFILTVVLIGGFMLVITGFATSMMRPKVTGGLMKLSGNTHVAANFSQVALVLPLFLIKLNAWFYLIIPLYILAGYTIFRYVKQTYRGHRRNVYQTLMN